MVEFTKQSSMWRLEIGLTTTAHACSFEPELSQAKTLGFRVVHKFHFLEQIFLPKCSLFRNLVPF